MLRGAEHYLKTLGLSGLTSAIRGRLTNSLIYFEVNRTDCEHPFRLRLPSSDVSTYEQVFIKEEYDFLVERQPRVIVDAGANIGLASIYFANKYPQAMIIAVEPENSNFELLKENVAPYARVVPVHAALWNKNEEIGVFDPGLGKWGFTTETKDFSDASAARCHTVMATTVDQLMARHEIDRIDILKVDIEGAEKEVFSDNSSWIQKIDSIIIELHDRVKPGCSQSFYRGSRGFDREWTRGENIYVSRHGCIAQRPC